MLNPKTVYDELKTNTEINFAGIITVNGTETYTLTWNSKLGGKDMYNEAYFSKDSYELLKFNQYIVKDDQKTKLISYDILMWEYTDTKPVITN